MLSFWQGMQASAKRSLAALVNASPHVQVRAPPPGSRAAPLAPRSAALLPAFSRGCLDRLLHATLLGLASLMQPDATRPPRRPGPPPQGLAIIQRGIWARRGARQAAAQAHFEALGFARLRLVAQLGVKGEGAGSYQCFVLRREPPGAAQAAAGGAAGAAGRAGQAGVAVDAGVWRQLYPRVRRGQ